MIERVCVVGAGVIGSLFAGHLGRVAEVSVLCRRDEHARALNEHGLRVSGKAEFVSAVSAATSAAELDAPHLVVVATKAGGLEDAAASLRGHWPDAAVMTVLNGLGAEEVVRRHGEWPLISAVTFISGTKHSDTHVEYILDTETWLGPYGGAPLRARGGRRRVDRALRPEGRGVAGPAARAVVEADLQRDGERRRGADGAAARLPLRAGGRAGGRSAGSCTRWSTRERRLRVQSASSCTTIRGR